MCLLSPSLFIYISALQRQSPQAGLLAVLVVPALLRRFPPEAYLKEWGEASHK